MGYGYPNSDREPLLKRLEDRIINCDLCPRLVEYRSDVARKRVRRFRDWVYWGRPLPGWGDPNARLLIVGLAPAAHGGYRTGRMFTGDSSGDWLVRALYETGFANQPISVSRDDGLSLRGCYITAVARCPPPKNKPVSEELINCQRYLIEEFRILSNLNAIVCLGRISFEWTLKALKKLYPNINSRRYRFYHGAKYMVDGTPYKLFISYHPSRQNTQTGRLKWDMWINIFKMIREELTNLC